MRYADRVKQWETQAKANLTESFRKIRRERQSRAPVPEPIYDEIFFQAVAAMDASEAPEIKSGFCVAYIDDSVLKTTA